MAVATSSFILLARGRGGSIWRYRTAADAQATIVGANYFDAVAGMVKVGDVIHATGSDAHKSYAVTVNSGSAVTVVAFT
jgi:hypothetical protein